MYEKLTEKFLSMKWDKNYITKLNASTISNDTIVSVLDSVLPDWTFKITHMIEVNGEMSVGGTLFLPGRTIDGTGSNEWSAISNIISKLTANVNDIPNVSLQQPNSVEKPKETVSSVQKKLEEIKAKTTQKTTEQSVNNAEEIFNDLMGITTPTVNIEEPSKEAESLPETVVQNDVNVLKTPTPDEVNPKYINMRQMWNDEQGKKLMDWAKEHNINGKEQMSSWFKRYCGLEYDYFNPEWVDKFILWAKALRERQTY